jgi:hypothetical protein
MELEQNNVYQSPLNGIALLCESEKPKKTCTGTTKIDHGFMWVEPVLQIRDVYPGSEIFPSRIPDPGSRGQKGPGSRIQIHNSGGNKTKRL